MVSYFILVLVIVYSSETWFAYVVYGSKKKFSWGKKKVLYTDLEASEKVKNVCCKKTNKSVTLKESFFKFNSNHQCQSVSEE